MSLDGGFRKNRKLQRTQLRGNEDGVTVGTTPTPRRGGKIRLPNKRKPLTAPNKNKRKRASG